MLGEQMDMDQDALAHRVGATRCGHYSVEKGHVVSHYETDRVYLVVDVDEYCTNSHMVGGNGIDVVELDRRSGTLLERTTGDESEDEDDNTPCTTEDVYPFYDTFGATFSPKKQSALDKAIYTTASLPPHKEFGGEHAASFCECCFVHFAKNYVTWGWDPDGLPRYFYSESPGRLNTCSSMCRRCKHDHPQGKVLWRWLRARVRARAITDYIYRLAHAPKYVSRLDAEMRLDMCSGFV